MHVLSIRAVLRRTANLAVDVSEWRNLVITLRRLRIIIFSQRGL
jgi:hypothetical protein